jgi:RHS repeat-associated protein
VWDGVFDPFGEEVAITGLAAMPLRFPGQYADEETGFSYNYFRDYEPRLGRYLQSDPIGLNGGANLFSYVDQNPISSTDPHGLDTIAGGATIKIPSIPYIYDGGGGTIGMALSYPGFFGGEWDFGLFCEIAKELEGSGSVGGTGKVGGELSYNRGSVRDLAGMGAEIQVDVPVTTIGPTPIPNPIGPSVGGQVSFDQDCNCLSGAGINAGAGSGITGSVTKTWVASVQSVLEWLGL